MTAKNLADRLGKLQRELDQCSEWVGRLSAEANQLPPSREKIDLVGRAEVAEILGLTISAVSQRQARGKLPAPVAEIKAGSIWLRSDIEAMR